MAATQEAHCGLQQCPGTAVDFVCASNNQTYSSPCRLHLANCLHRTNLTVACSGFCPCTPPATGTREAERKKHWKAYMDKYQRTLHKKISNATPKQKVCTERELRAMGDRLLGWFTVVMADHKRGLSRRRSFRLSHGPLGARCRAEVAWMFQHLDTDGDGQLSLRELYDLEHDDREACLRPYLLDCDLSSPQDLVLTPTEWCACFDRSREEAAAQYHPQCDDEGYFLPTQCREDTCWCVDRHGFEFANTRRLGQPDCPGLLLHGPNNGSDNIGDDDDDETDDEEEDYGSGHKPLEF
ncbi:SPOCK3 [Cordylochernes scorpioides]|uniref:SPOCK3 n=1 Tax=Cordylochernes scorpioides TaxID=51811 RepID=A0ABY6K8I2_9ARAC|nr:SPOCK3 [Cordylochernes scorpioides]